MGNNTIPIKVWIAAESAVLLNTLAEQHQQPFDRIIELALAVFHQQSGAQPVSASAFDSTSAIDRLSASLTELEHRIAVHLVAMRNDLDTFNSRLNVVEHSGAHMDMLAELDCRLRSVENMAGFSTTELGGLRQRVAMLEELSRKWDYLEMDEPEVLLTLANRKHRASSPKK